MKTFKICLLLPSIIFLAGCSGSSGGGSAVAAAAPTASTSGQSISGVVQKGPFIQGSTITVQELDASLNPTGASYQTETTDSTGAFSIQSQIKSQFVEIVATGYYYNEVSGNLSDSTLTLRVFADLSVSNSVNLNILTSLAHDRIKALVQTGVSFASANIVARSEVLSIFSIKSDSVVDFGQMDLSHQGSSDAILIACSAILQGASSVAQLSEFLAQIGSDVASNGAITSAVNKQMIISNASQLNAAQITLNLQNRFQSLGITVSVPAFATYVTAASGPTTTTTLPVCTAAVTTNCLVNGTTTSGGTVTDGDLAAGSSAQLTLTTPGALDTMFYNSNPSDPSNISINIDFTRQSDTIIVSYAEDGQTYDAGFGTLHPYSGYSSNEFNGWISQNGQAIYKGFFQDAYGAVVLIVDSQIPQSSGQPGMILGGSIWLQNFARSAPSNGQQGPLKMCWEITEGPYDCRTFISNGNVDVLSSYYPNNKGSDASMNYQELGTFTEIISGAANFPGN